MAKPVDPFVLICKVGHSNSKSFSAGLQFANGNGGKKSNSNSWSVFIENCSNPRCVSNKNSCKIKAVFSEHYLLYHSDQIELKELKIACFSATEGEIAPFYKSGNPVSLSTVVHNRTMNKKFNPADDRSMSKILCKSLSISTTSRPNGEHPDFRREKVPPKTPQLLRKSTDLLTPLIPLL
ncbi:hypothetical protein Gotur_034554 [Gossypium turneri]